MAASGSGERRWQVSDSIAVRYIAGSVTTPGMLVPSIVDRSIVWSPDRAHFFFIARRGELRCDCNEYELYVFDAGELARELARHDKAATAAAPQPLRRVSFASSRSDPFFQGISEPRWDGDDAILFFAVQGEGPRHVYRLDVGTGVTTQLTSGSRDVISYAVKGPAVVYSVREKTPRTALDEYPMRAVLDDDLFELGGASTASSELLTARRGTGAESLGRLTASLSGPWMSPDGKHAIVATQSAAVPIPPTWVAYEVKPRPKRPSASRFMLIDLERKRMRPLFDAPLGKATRAGWNSMPNVLWSSDGKRAVLVNTALPLSNTMPERQRTPYIVEVELRTGEWKVVDSLTTAGDADIGNTVAQVVTVEWYRQDRELLVKRQRLSFGAHDARDPLANEVELTAYARVASGWVRVKSGPRVASRGEPGRKPPFDLQVTLRQSANDPPIPVAANGRRELPLLPPDPALAGIHRSRVAAVQWREPDGRLITGGLLLPANYSALDPVPVVIQASAYSPDLFLPDGSSTTAFAAQALASAGMAVLAVDIPAEDADEQRRAVMGTVREGMAFVDRIDAAVDGLSQQYAVDTGRIGLIGFSRSGFMTYYAITHPGRVELAAAVVADGWSASYGEYVIDAATSAPGADSSAEFETYYGRGTFWENKQTWLEHAPAFNVDRVVTPALFTTGTKANNLLTLETVGAFRLNRRPFEYLSFRDGAHQLQRPRERLASLSASVDWMAFWLLGREDPDPAKIERYERWKALREQWQGARSKESRSGRSTAVPQ